MATFRFSIRYPCWLTALAAIALTAACGGSQTQLSPAGPAQNNATKLQSPTLAPAAKKEHCHHGGVRVSPCSVDFSISSPGPDMVTVRKARDKKGSLTESDNCGGAAGIATLVQGSGGFWIVTAGPTTGSCAAEFDRVSKHGKTLGSAKLSITNSV